MNVQIFGYPIHANLKNDFHWSKDLLPAQGF